MKLFSNSITALERGLDYASLQQKTIANNIANVDTPNYKAKDVKFKRLMEDAQHSLSAVKTDPRHLEFSSMAKTMNVAQIKASYSQNGNSVDLDAEMSKLAENQLYYNALTDRLGSKFTSLSNVIKGGR